MLHRRQTPYSYSIWAWSPIVTLHIIQEPLSLELSHLEMNSQSDSVKHKPPVQFFSVLPVTETSPCVSPFTGTVERSQNTKVAQTQEDAPGGRGAALYAMLCPEF